MGLRARPRPEASKAGLGGASDIYAACDHCKEEIWAGDPGNVEFDRFEDSEVFTLHKRCSAEFRHRLQMKASEATVSLAWATLERVTVVTR